MTWRLLGQFTLALAVPLLATMLLAPTSPRDTLYRALVLADRPIAYWRLAESTATDAVKDETPHHLDGRYRGSVAFAAPRPTADRSAPALGGSGYVDLGNPAALDLKSGKLTVEVWVNAAIARDKTCAIISRGQSSGQGPGNSFVLAICDGDYVAGMNDGKPHVASFPVPAEDCHRWVHLVVVYDGTNWLIYRNGVESACTADPTGLLPIAGGWRAGRGIDANDLAPFVGSIADLAIYDEALSVDQIAAHYRAAVGRPTTQP